MMLMLFSCKEKQVEPSLVKPLPERDSTVNESADTTVDNFTAVDLSPMDMSYYPTDYPKLKMADHKIAPPVARVIYSRPHLQGRQLFHDVLKYGEHWRLGANESTEIDFFRDVTIQGKKVKAGRYVMYCILGPGTWNIALNSNIDSWGLQQDTTKDVNRFEIPVTHGNPSLEYYTMVFSKTANGADLIMAWDDVMAKLPIEF
jgi:Protein of unknown function (DUF2911)